MIYSCSEIKNHLGIRYQALMDFADFGLILVDLAGNIIDVNRTALELLGSPSKEETMAINMLSYEPLQEAGVSDLIKEAIVSKKKIEKNIMYTSRWGRELNLKATACAVPDAENDPCLVAFLMSDITELEKLKDKLGKMAKVLALTVDAIDTHYITAKDKEGKYHVVNKAFADLLGKTIKEIIGKTDFDLWDTEYAEKIRREDQEVLVSCGTLELDECVTHSNFEPKRMHTVKTAICSDDDIGELVVSISEDVTQEYKKQTAAKQAIKELERLLHG